MYQGNNPKSKTQTLTPQSAKPTNPVEGMVFYSDGTVLPEGVYKYSNGLWKNIESTDNYISNPDAENSTTNWNKYDDGAVAKPIDGTGGSAGQSSFGTLGTPNNLRGNNSFYLQVPVSNAAQGEGVSTDFIVDSADKASMVQVSFDYRTYDAYADDDYICYIYDITNARLIEFADGTIKANALSTTFNRSFQASPDSVSYRFIMHIATADTTRSKGIIFDKVEAKSAKPAIIGAPDVYLGALTTTGHWTTNSTYIANYWRRGDKLIAIVYIGLSGAPNSGAFTVNLPSGLVIDSAKMIATNIRSVSSGTWTIYDSSVGTSYGGIMKGAGTTAVQPYMIDAGSVTGVIGASGPVVLETGDSLYMEYEVPIVGWSSGVVMSETTMNREISLSACTSTSSSLADTIANYVGFENKIFEKGGSNIINPTVAMSTTYANAWGYVVPENGTYEVDAQVEIVVNVAFSFSCYIMVNNVEAAVSRILTQGTSAYYDVKVTKLLPLIKGDVIKIAAVQNSGVSKAIYGDPSANFINIRKSNTGSQTIAASESVYASYNSTTGQSFANASSVVINFATKEHDTHNAVTVGASWVFTAPRTGMYSVKSSIQWANTTNLTISALNLFVNGVFYRQVDLSTVAKIGLTGTTDVYLTQGQTLSAVAYQADSGSAARLLRSTGPEFNFITIHSI